jgi:Tol biopolymer transport system component
LQDGALQQITHGPEVWRQPAWSPDGTTIGAQSLSAGKTRIVLLPLDGGDRVNLAADFDDVEYPRWSPDGPLPSPASTARCGRSSPSPLRAAR